MSERSKRDRKPVGAPGRGKAARDAAKSQDKRSTYTGADGERNPFQRRKRITTGSNDNSGRTKTEDRPYKSRSTEDKPSFRTERPARKFDGPKPEGGSTFRSERPARKFEGNSEDSPYRSRSTEDKPSFRTERPARKYDGPKPEGGGSYKSDRPAKRTDDRKPRVSAGRPTNRVSAATKPEASGTIRLNKFLADAGVCSRREADVLITAGTVTVNGVVVTELGTKVNVYDKVNYGGQTLNRETLRYILLNKPKDYITTSDDPFDRKTVMELVTNACSERIYPVGRLDRNTTGLLLLTNDGDLAKKLMHPKHGVAKLYHVELDKALTKNDLIKIGDGIELEDGIAEVDEIAWVDKAESKNEVGIKIHSGKNRIVRRIFESLGYEVVKLDRVTFAGLTKVNLTRGKWRHLLPKELSMLKAIK